MIGFAQASQGRSEGHYGSLTGRCEHPSHGKRPKCRGGPVLDFRLDDEQEALRKTVEQFAREVVAPQAARFDESGEFPYDIVRQMGEMGLFGLPFPEEYGGMGGDYFALCLAIE